MMRPMSLKSDLEAEMWALLHELVFRHNLSSEDAYATTRQNSIPRQGGRCLPPWRSPRRCGSGL